MNKWKLTWVVLAVLAVTAGVQAQSSFNQEIVPEGMESVQIGGSGWLIIPKGAKTRKVGAQIIVEGVREYMSRRFEETDERLMRMEGDLNAIKTELESMRKNLTPVADAPKEVEKVETTQ